jgi:hypothetical protein
VVQALKRLRVSTCVLRMPLKASTSQIMAWKVSSVVLLRLRVKPAGRQSLSTRAVPDPRGQWAGRHAP